MSSYTKAKTDEFESNKKKTKWESFLSGIYNKKKGTFLGRTGKSWGLILIFYLIFYSCLSGFWIGMISVFMFGFIPVNEPMRTGKNSILTFTPGVNINPLSLNDSGLVVGSSNVKNKYYEKYLNLVDLYFKKSNINGPNHFGVDCNDTAKNEPRDVTKFCRFDKKLLGPCASPKTELDSNRLCVYVRANKVYGWLPQIENKSLSNDILLDCVGQNPGDINNLGKPTYYPSFTHNNKTYGRISNMFFPYIKQANYTSPIVAVQFNGMSRNLAILVQCSLVNIVNVYKPARFEVMLMENEHL